MAEDVRRVEFVNGPWQGVHEVALGEGRLPDEIDMDLDAGQQPHAGEGDPWGVAVYRLWEKDGGLRYHFTGEIRRRHEAPLSNDMPLKLCTTDQLILELSDRSDFAGVIIFAKRRGDRDAPEQGDEFIVASRLAKQDVATLLQHGLEAMQG